MEHKVFKVGDKVKWAVGWAGEGEPAGIITDGPFVGAVRYVDGAEYAIYGDEQAWVIAFDDRSAKRLGSRANLISEKLLDKVEDKIELKSYKIEIERASDMKPEYRCPDCGHLVRVNLNIDWSKAVINVSFNPL